MITIDNFVLNNIDNIMVVNKEFVVTYNSRFDIQLPNRKMESSLAPYAGQNFFSAFPSVERKQSSVLETMTTGEIVVKKKQEFRDFMGNIYCTNNITIPIILEGKINGVVELAKNVTDIEFVDHHGSSINAEDEFDLLIEQIKGKSNETTFDDIITMNPVMLACIEQAKVAVKTLRSNLIYGETGTGKELFVQAMINSIGVPKKKIVIQNCASVPENLMESILFGTQKGAYTGAETRKGLFEEADGGVLFLDELNSLPIQLQGKLLRVLEDGTFRPVGGNHEKKVNVKIIAAMNVDPMEAVKQGILRKDLFYRLSNGMIYLPPLRERKEDIPLFVKNYIVYFNRMYQKNVTGITDSLQNLFLNYDWEGNVRELKHVVENMISMSEVDILDIRQLPTYMYDNVHCSPDDLYQKQLKIESISQSTNTFPHLDLNEYLKLAERNMIIAAMQKTKGNKTKAGEILGIPRQTLKYKITKLNISPTEWK